MKDEETESFKVLVRVRPLSGKEILKSSLSHRKNINIVHVQDKLVSIQLHIK